MLTKILGPADCYSYGAFGQRKKLNSFPVVEHESENRHVGQKLSPWYLMLWAGRSPGTKDQGRSFAQGWLSMISTGHSEREPA